MALGCAFLFGMIWVFIISINRPYIGASVAKDLTVASIRAGGPADLAGLSSSDTILSWDGEKVSSYFDFQRRLRAEAPKDEVKLEVISESGETQREIILTVDTAPFPLKLLFGIVLALVLFGCAVFILINTRYRYDLTLTPVGKETGELGRVGVLFYLMIVALSFGIVLILFERLVPFYLLSLVVITLSAFAVFPLFLHITYIFPSDKKIGPKPLLGFYLPAFIIGLLVLIFLIKVVYFVKDEGAAGKLEALGGIGHVLLISSALLFLIYLGGGLFFLIRSYYAHQTTDSRNQVKWFFLGLGIASVPIIYFFALLLSRGFFGHNLGGYDLLLLMTFALPASMVFSITKYRLTDIDTLLNRVMVYSILFFTLIIIYLVLISLLGRVFGIETPIRHTWMALIPVLVVGGLFEPLRRWFQRWIDRIFFREKFSYMRTISDFSRHVLSIIDLDVLLHTSLEVLNLAMGVKNSVISLYDRARRSYRVRAVLGDIPIREGMIYPSTFWVREYLDESTTVVKLMPGPKDERKGYFKLMLVLRGRDGIFGILGLSGKKKGGLFSSEDIRLLKAMTAQLTMAIQNCIMIEESRIAATTREAYGRFLSHALVDKIMADPEKVKLGGENLKVAVLFTDLRDFTKTTVGMAPQEVVGLLNEYFSVMTDVVFSYNGTLDKYTGDGVMTLFGAPIPEKDDPLRAVKAAREMQKRIFEINRARKGEKKVTLQVGIGIDLGIVTVGNIGSQRRMEYTAIGDAVNLASRLTDVAGPGEILITDEVHDLVKNEIHTEEHKNIKVKGKNKPVHIYKVIWQD